MRKSKLFSTVALTLCTTFVLIGSGSAASQETAPGTWPTYGRDPGGTRYSDAALLTTDTVSQLRRQWTYRTGDLAHRATDVMKGVKFQTTPILAGDRLVLCSSFNEIIALDPATGAEAWRFDPGIPTDLRPANRYNCRGVAQWNDQLATANAACALRILSATTDSRLIAVDARSGVPCSGFGTGGQVRIDTGELARPGELQVSSAPVIAGDVVIVGSAISDNQRAEAPSGRVHAFDARSGELLWSWNPLVAEPGAIAGAANVWAPMSVDVRRGLVFLPTSSPSPDFYGGLRPGPNRHSDSVVALHAADGSLAWTFQIVKHDVWDYDVAAQPSLTSLTIDGDVRDVVVQATKQGLVFVLDRDTGESVFPIEERAVPQGGAPGEQLSATQIFPVDMPSLVPTVLRAEDAYGFTPYDRGACRDRIAQLRNEGLYTPPSVGGTLLFPFTGGGVNWGGVAIDPQGIVYVNTSRMPHSVRLVERADFAAVSAAMPDQEVSPQSDTPFGMVRELVTSPFGAPCNKPPWGTIAALDLLQRKILWEVPLGTTEELLPLGIALHIGTPNAGGPVATAGGLVFIGAAMDRYLRAFNSRSGAELWRGQIPFSAMATPMTYMWEGRQYVVVAAGGHGEFGAPTGDAIVAFALPAPGEAPRSWSERWIEQPGVAATGRIIFGVIIVSCAFIFLRRLRWRKHRRSA